MAKHKVTRKQLEGFVKEELESSKLYNKLGFKSQAKDEKKHSEFFKRKLKLKQYKTEK